MVCECIEEFLHDVMLYEMVERVGDLAEYVLLVPGQTRDRGNIDLHAVAGCAHYDEVGHRPHWSVEVHKDAKG